MAVGTVKWFSDAKGYGFIQPDDHGTDIFAHFSAINMPGFKTLSTGARVHYELHDGPKGPHALNIHPAEVAEVDAVRDAHDDPESGFPQSADDLPQAISAPSPMAGAPLAMQLSPPSHD